MRQEIVAYLLQLQRSRQVFQMKRIPLNVRHNHDIFEYEIRGKCIGISLFVISVILFAILLDDLLLNLLEKLSLLGRQQ